MFRLVPMEGVEPTHSYEYQILSLARLPIPPHRLMGLLSAGNIPDAPHAAQVPEWRWAGLGYSLNLTRFLDKGGSAPGASGRCS